MSTNELFTWRSCGLTFNKRQEQNQDSHLALPQQGLWVVVDNLNLANSSNNINRTLVDAFQNFTFSRTLSKTIDDLESRVLRVNDKWHSNASKNNENFQVSAFTALYMRNQYAFFLWAGDIRLYRYRKGKLEILSHDHSAITGENMSGDESDKKTKQMRRHLARAVGLHRDLYLDIDYTEIKSDDKFILCTPSLYESITHSEMLRLANQVPYKASQNLINAALRRNSEERITVIVVNIIPIDKK